MSDAGAVRLRDAVDADRPGIEALTRAAYAEFQRAMAPLAWAALSRAMDMGFTADDPGIQRIVAEHQGRLVGSVMLYPPASSAYGDMAGSAAWSELRLLAVAPGVRGLGVGRALVDECARRARDMGARELGLHTSRSMASAIRLYVTMGFVRVPDHDFQPEGAELVEAYKLFVGQEMPSSGT